MSDGNSDYQLGSADDELARLELQGRALAPATRMIFAAAVSGDVRCGDGWGCLRH